MNNSVATLTDRLLAFLRQHPDQWIDGMELARVAGCYGWRSRVADVRRLGHVVENRVRTLRAEGGEVRKVSEYRLKTTGLITSDKSEVATGCNPVPQTGDLFGPRGFLGPC